MQRERERVKTRPSNEAIEPSPAKLSTRQCTAHKRLRKGLFPPPTGFVIGAGATDPIRKYIKPETNLLHCQTMPLVAYPPSSLVAAACCEENKKERKKPGGNSAQCLISEPEKASLRSSAPLYRISYEVTPIQQRLVPARAGIELPPPIAIHEASHAASEAHRWQNTSLLTRQLPGLMTVVAVAPTKALRGANPAHRAMMYKTQKLRFGL
ncbi:hypothetical protein EDD17DRAFT_714622 [Pisolithus thermaeus]|nr:hypothetical protein EDD17DRAFT_714622 [Pisolithus thermaeus]